MTFLPPKIADEYEIIEALGHGATSVVYKVERKSDGKFFAIKLLHNYLVEKDDALKRFEQEAHATMLLSHPSIVKVHELDKTPEGQPYLVMDFVEGDSLAEVLSHDGHLPLPRAWKLFIQIAEAMAHAHSHGVVHRSLKPGNIIITMDSAGHELAVVSDFGLAKLLPSSGQEIQQLTKKGAVIGSPLYMSPEQCLGREIDGRSDIYSMGCLMYAVLSGKPPLKGEHIIDTMSKHVSEIPLSFDKICPDHKIPSAVQAIVFKCMAKRPDDRFETMEQLRLDLVRFQGGKKPRALNSAAPIPEHAGVTDNVVDDEEYLKIGLIIIAALLAGLVIFAIWKTPQHKDPNKVELGKSFSDAQHVVHTSSSHRPISSLALLKQADELRMLNRADEARALYREAISRADEQQHAQTAVDNEVLATAHYGLAGIFLRASDWTAAEKELRLALYVQGLCAPGSAPGKERLELDLASCLMHQGKLAESKTILKDLAKESGDTIDGARAYMSLADIAKSTNNLNEAEGYELKAQEILKKHKDAGRRLYCIALSRYANELITKKQYDKAVSLMKAAMYERPAAEWNNYDADAAVFLTGEIARVLSCTKNYDAAIAVCKQTSGDVASRDFHKYDQGFGAADAEILTDIQAALKVLSGHASEGKQMLSDSLAVEGERLGRIATLARILIYEKNTKDAMDLLAKYKKMAYRRDTTKAEFLALNALCLSQEGRGDEAIKYCDLALDSLGGDSDDALRSYCLAAKAHVLRDMKKDDAASVIEKAIAVPDNEAAKDFDFLVPTYQRRGLVS